MLGVVKGNGKAWIYRYIFSIKTAKNTKTWQKQKRYGAKWDICHNQIAHPAKIPQ